MESNLQKLTIVSSRVTEPMETQIEFSSELQTQAFKILSSNDVKPMETLFSHLFSDQEPQRSQAYILLCCGKTYYPSLLFIKLFFLLRCSPSVDTRTNAANSLRLLQVRDLWHKLTPKTQSSLKFHFLDCLRNEESMANLRIICNVVSDITCEIYKSKNQWPELLEFLVRSVEAGNDKFRETALLVFAYLPKDCRVLVSGALLSSAETLHKAFLNILCSKNMSFFVVAVRAMVSLKPLLSGSSEHDGFRDVLRGMMVGLYHMLVRTKEDNANKITEELLSLIAEESKVMKPYMNYLVSDMTDIVEKEVLNVESKRCAIRFLFSLAEVADLEKLPYRSVLRLFSTSMEMLLFIEDDLAWYQVGIEGENAGKTDVYNFGMDCLNRLAIAFGEKKIVPVAFQLLPMYMDAQEWQKRHAGITMLAVIAKECSDEMVMMGDYMEQALSRILKSFQDTHPRVNWAAFNLMQLPVDFVRVAQILHHPRVAPALASAVINQNRNPRVKEQIIAAVSSFIKNIPIGGLTVHVDLDGLVRKLLVWLQTDDNTVQGRKFLLSTFNIIAQQRQEVVVKHCADYLPIILEACNDQTPEIKQEATRGIRVCAEFGGSRFKPFAKIAISKLSIVLGYPNRSYSEDLKAYDIAVSALGKICEFHHDCVDVSKLLPTWLNLLPAKDDLTEAKIVHEQLCSMVERSDRMLLGLNSQFLPKIITVFLEVKRHGNQLAKMQTVGRMTNWLKQLWNKLPHATMDAIVSSLNAQQQETLRSVIFS